MKKGTKIWLITAASLIVIGCIVFGGVMTMLNWDFSKLSTSKYETNTHAVGEAFQSISVHANTADIRFALSEDNNCSVVCYERTNRKHAVSVKDGALTVEVVDTRKWYEYIGINFGTPKITIYLPQGEYGALSIKSSTGDVEISKDFTFASIDIEQSTGDVCNYASATESIKIKTTTGGISVENVSAGSLELSVSTGRVTASGVECQGDVSVRVTTGKTTFSNVSCKNLITSGSTGNVSLTEVIAAEKFSIERSTGSVTFERCDASEIFVETDTGNVKGSLLTDKIFMTQTDTGRISVPDSVMGGRCEIKTDTGDIKITVGP